MFKARLKKIFSPASLSAVYLYIVLGIGVGILIPLSILLIYTISFGNKIYPNVQVAGTSVSNLTTNEASSLLKKSFPQPKSIEVVYEGEIFEMDLAGIGFSYNYTQSANNAYRLYRGEETASNILQSIKALYIPREIPLVFLINDSKLQEYLSIYQGQVATEPVYPSVALADNQIVVKRGSPGTGIDIESATQNIINNFAMGKPQKIVLTKTIIDPSLTNEEVTLLTQRAKSIVNKEITLEFEYAKFTYSGNELLKFLDGKGGYDEKNIELAYKEVNSSISRAPQNPIFKYLPAQTGSGGKVQEFLPAKDGVEIDKEIFKELVESLLVKIETTNSNSPSKTIPILSAPSEIKTGDVNDLGIKELIGRGSSKFKGSIPSRIYNIGLSSSKFDGVLIAPGEIISFNEIVGDISSLTGYKQAYIIQGGRTVLGDGGGVCQVSTTFFRAMLDAGLPIVDRNAHSYRVKYYEQDSLPGIDATIYVPTVDLQAKNDTPGYILIQTIFDADTQTLVFEIYGTSDGRVSEISKPIITSETPPPEALYQDDPNLPNGTVKQIDWAAWGAKVQFDYKVTRNGEVLQDETFYSNYRPWQAVFLRGTGPAT